MARGPKKHLKRLKAPKHWMLDKLSGVFAPRPSTGPHKMRESLPLMILLRDRLKYALTKRECQTILMNRLVKVRGLGFLAEARCGGRYSLPPSLSLLSLAVSLAPPPPPAPPEDGSR
eukprot:COSAG03_NODE_640_length_6556_cov_4.146817_3_plen_117_part_00